MDDSKLVNCRTCRTGKHWWVKKPEGLHPPGYICSTCHGDPYVAGSGRADWRDFDRAGFVQMFGPRADGDLELLEKYKDEL